jgi:hypothetical protein
MCILEWTYTLKYYVYIHLLYKAKTYYIYEQREYVAAFWNAVLPSIHITFYKYGYISTHFSARYIHIYEK